jgi:hypothetical protein
MILEIGASLAAATTVAASLLLSSPAGAGEDALDFETRVSDNLERPTLPVLIGGFVSALGLFSATFVFSETPIPDIAFLAVLSFFAAADWRKGLVPIWAAPLLLWLALGLSLVEVARQSSDGAIVWGLATWLALHVFRFVAVAANTSPPLAGGDIPIVAAAAAYLGFPVLLSLVFAAAAGMIVARQARARFLPYFWLGILLTCWLPSPILKHLVAL